MKRARLETVMGLARRRSVRILAAIGLFYIFIMSFEVPFVFKSVPMDGGSVTEYQGQNEPLSLRNQRLDSEWELLQKTAPIRPLKESLRVSTPSQSGSSTSKRIMTEYKTVSGLQFDWRALNNTGTDGFSELHKIAMFSFQMGEKFWKELRSGKVQIAVDKEAENRTESCPNSITLSGADWSNTKNIMVLPCGLTLGSHITLVAKPRVAHAEYDPKISMLKEGDQSVMVSQFMMELLGLKTVDGEEPPRILHFNPRLKGDWTEKPVIEQNTCYRQQWGSALRCEGWKSKPDEETVDSMPKCEKWIRDNDDGHEEVSKTTWWLTRLIRRKKKVKIDWPFPFSEDKLFVLTLSAGLEGYHINVDGRHVTSFPYRTGFSLEDATGLTVNGDIDVHSVFAASLPSTHPSFAPQRHLEMSFRWQAPPLPSGPTDLFIGILSAGNHFAERMAVRKTWMQHKLIKSSKIVARFFVALHARKEVNAVLLREAKFFGDIVIVPYMDTYDLVVIKTVAICEYGVRTVSAKYIMKCDDDTFVHIDAIMNEVRKIPEGGSLYIGNINYYHRPLRYGKWAVTYEEWPEEVYPPYANGPGYVLSSDIAHYVVSEFENHKLRLFKMEDVSMGMWVERFNSSIPVHYVHSLKFCQFGCIEDYYTAHYQSPKQMICLWNKLQRLGSPLCCNMR